MFVPFRHNIPGTVFTSSPCQVWNWANSLMLKKKSFLLLVGVGVLAKWSAISTVLSVNVRPKNSYPSPDRSWFR